MVVEMEITLYKLQDQFGNFQSLTNNTHRVLKSDGKMIIGIKEGITMTRRIEIAIPLIQQKFTLKSKEIGRYFDGEKLRNGLFYILKKEV